MGLDSAHVGWLQVGQDNNQAVAELLDIDFSHKAAHDGAWP